MESSNTAAVQAATAPAGTTPCTLREFLGYFVRLGTFGFGGPIALAGHMEHDLVEERRWIEKKDYNWVKVEAESIDTISFGFFLARIHKGARFNLEQVHLNDEVWLVRRFFISGGARLALVKNEAIEQEDTFSNYKKFVTSSRILPGVKEAPAEQPK